MQISKVYAVIGGFDCEGEFFDSLRLFDCASSAEAYYQRLTDVDGYDYALMEVKDVCMESAICAA
jgi:hypothetical protein